MFELSLQVAIKIIDKTQLNPSSLQKVCQSMYREYYGLVTL